MKIIKYVVFLLFALASSLSYTALVPSSKGYVYLLYDASWGTDQKKETLKTYDILTYFLNSVDVANLYRKMGDPAPGEKKSLKVYYKRLTLGEFQAGQNIVNAKENVIEVREGQRLKIPTRIGDGYVYLIYNMEYGILNDPKRTLTLKNHDLTTPFLDRTEDEMSEFHYTLYDPARTETKTLTIQYRKKPVEQFNNDQNILDAAPQVARATEDQALRFK